VYVYVCVCVCVCVCMCHRENVIKKLFIVRSFVQSCAQSHYPALNLRTNYNNIEGSTPMHGHGPEGRGLYPFVCVCVFMCVCMCMCVLCVCFYEDASINCPFRPTPYK